LHLPNKSTQAKQTIAMWWTNFESLVYMMIISYLTSTPSACIWKLRHCLT
jgi:hypothetical protein